MYTGEQLQLRLTFNRHDKVGYDFSAGPAIVALAPAGGAIAVQISSLAIQLNVETNEEIRAQLINKVNTEGLSFMCPYMYAFKQVGGANTTTTLNVRLNRGHGSRLLRTYIGSISQPETLQNSYLNIVPTHVRTSVNNVFLQDNALASAVDEPWLFMQDIVKRSGLNDSIVYPAFWTFIDNFTSAKPYDKQDDVVDGIDLAEEKQYGASLTLGATASNIYVFAIAQRTVMIKGGQIGVS
jgi:hypothetical protein